MLLPVAYLTERTSGPPAATCQSSNCLSLLETSQGRACFVPPHTSWAIKQLCQPLKSWNLQTVDLNKYISVLISWCPVSTHSCPSSRQGGGEFLLKLVDLIITIDTNLCMPGRNYLDSGNWDGKALPKCEPFHPMGWGSRANGGSSLRTRIYCCLHSVIKHLMLLPQYLPYITAVPSCRKPLTFVR